MYQTRRVPFTNKENYSNKRIYRAEEKAKNRRVSRQRNFCSNRNISTDHVRAVEQESKEVFPEPKNLSRSEMLKRWKQEKEKIKKAEKEKKSKVKPPFKCGKVHHSPPPVLGAEYRRSTRVKNNLNSKQAVKVVIPIKENLTSKRNSKQSHSSKRSFQSFAPLAHQFKPPVNLPKIEENSMSPATDATEWSDFTMVFPAQLSPWISKGRGSEREKSPKAAERMNNETPLSSKKTLSAVKVTDLSKRTPDTLRVCLGKQLFKKSLRTPEVLKNEVKKPTPRHGTPALSKEDSTCLENFRSLYEGELNRLHVLCSQWDSILSSNTCHEIPVEVQDSVHAAVGQTRLLMKEKLGQFNDLLQKFQVKTLKSSPVITSSDLQGFWDLVSIQVNDVDAKFSNLDSLKWNNWVAVEEQKPKIEKSVFQRRNTNSSNVKTKKPVAAKSSLKAYIAEQRKKLEEAKGEAPLKDNRGSIKKVKAEGNRTPLLLNQSLAGNPTSILRRRSSQRLNSKAGLSEKGGNTTPRRSSRRVMFSDNTMADDRPKFQVVKSPYVSAAEKDLISWESPSNDLRHLGLRSSSRLSKDKEKQF